MSDTYRVTFYGRRGDTGYTNRKGVWRGEAESIGGAIDKANDETPQEQRGTWVSAVKEAAMSDATTPANPTDQIAATRAIYRHDEDVRLVQSAILGLEWTEAKQAALDRIAAHIERLEAERYALAQQVLVLATTDLRAPADLGGIAQYATTHKSGQVVYVNAMAVVEATERVIRGE